eukprot:355651-Prorocentrum_minimum.AAC.14
MPVPEVESPQRVCSAHFAPPSFVLSLPNPPIARRRLYNYHAAYAPEDSARQDHTIDKRTSPRIHAGTHRSSHTSLACEVKWKYEV